MATVKIYNNEGGLVAVRDQQLTELMDLQNSMKPEAIPAYVAEMDWNAIGETDYSAADVKRELVLVAEIDEDTHSLRMFDPAGTYGVSMLMPFFGDAVDDGPFDGSLVITI